MEGKGGKGGREGIGEGRGGERGEDVEGPGKWSAPGPVLALGGPAPKPYYRVTGNKQLAAATRIYFVHTYRSTREINKM